MGPEVFELEEKLAAAQSGAKVDPNKTKEMKDPKGK